MKGKAIYLIFPLAMIILGGAITDAPAATLAGKVAIVRGKVTAVAEDGQKRNLAAKAPIYVNDTIETAANSQAQILFEDETVYTIGPQSDLKIDQFVYDPEKSVGDLVVGATKGSFRMITGSIAKKAPERVKVRTPVATIGIRGTYFAGTFNGATLNTLLVGGAIFVENQGGGKEIRTPGFGTKVISDSKAPEPPKKFTQREIKQIMAPTEIMAAAPASDDSGDTANFGEGDILVPANPLPTEGPPTNPDPEPCTNCTTQPPPTPPAPPTYSLSGKYIAAAGTTFWSGGVSGSIVATDTVRYYSLNNGGSLASLNLSGPLIDLTAIPYHATGQYGFPAQNLWGYSFPAGFSVYDGRGEFSYFVSPGSNFLFGYAGLPIGAAVAPASGIGIYKGLGGVAISDGLHDVDTLSLFINWGTNKVFGSILNKSDEQMFVTGTYDPASKTIINTQIFGKMFAGTADDFVKSTPFSMEFFGSAMQGIGGIANGDDRTYQNTILSTWTSALAAIGNTNAVPTPRTNNQTYGGGFVAGISIPRDTGLSDLALLTNANPTDVVLNLNRSSGTVGGSFSNITGTGIGSAKIHTLTFTLNAANSYYVDDNAFVNLDIAASGNVSPIGAVSNVAGGGFVGTNPNLWDAPTTSDPNHINIIDYGHLTWGYWAAEYSDGSTQYNITPGSYWLAGLLTLNASIPAGGTGTYTGPAMGQAYDKGALRYYTMTGTSNLTADFTAKTLTGTLSMADNPGGANRMQWTVTLNGGWTAGTNAISGSSNASIVPYSGGVPGGTLNAAGTMAGAFFDTNSGPATAVGGNWKVDSANHSATGIFVGR